MSNSIKEGGTSPELIVGPKRKQTIVGVNLEILLVLVILLVIFVDMLHTSNIIKSVWRKALG